MSKINRWKTTTTLMLSIGMGAATLAPVVAPLVLSAPAVAQATSFPDVPQGYWAKQYIEELTQRNIISGFPDGTFKPDAPVTRAQFSSLISGAFSKSETRSSINFVDVSSNYWARSSIDKSYKTGFLSGYPGNIFRPEQNIPREQVIVSLASGLNYTTGAVDSTLNYYNDATSISSWARSPIAAATQRSMVVNYPTVKNLNPSRNATRAEVAAFIYQALVNQGQASAISSPYVVNQAPVASSFTIPAGSVMPVSYDKEKILLTKDETVPVTLMVKANIVNSNQRILIPAGTKVEGKLQPTASGGTQFMAEKLIYANGTSQNVSATSQVITETETIRKGVSIGDLAKNAGIGTAAAAAISAITGDRAIATEELLLGAGLGALVELIPTFLGLNKVDLL
ncbi:MAG: S-layer homology domain-containing protein, partial [Spirulinaceae cyanobacterium]